MAETFEHVENSDTRALLLADPSTLARQQVIDASDQACDHADDDLESCDVPSEVVSDRVDFAHSALYAAHYGSVAEAHEWLCKFWAN